MVIRQTILKVPILFNFKNIFNNISSVCQWFNVISLKFIGKAQPGAHRGITTHAATAQKPIVTNDLTSMMVSVDLEKGIDVSNLKKLKPIEPALRPIPAFDVSSIDPQQYVEKKRRKVDELALERAKRKLHQDRAKLDERPLAMRIEKKMTQSNTHRRRVPSKAEQKMFPTSKHNSNDSKSGSVNQKVYITKPITSELLKRSQSQYSRIIEPGMLIFSKQINDNSYNAN